VARDGVEEAYWAGGAGWCTLSSKKKGRSKLTPKEQQCVSRKIKFLVTKEKKRPDQAAAIAYQYCVPKKARPRASTVAARAVRLAVLGQLWTRLRAAWPRFMEVLKAPTTTEDLAQVKNVVTEFGDIPLMIAKQLEEGQVLSRGTHATFLRAHNQILASPEPSSEPEIKKGRDQAGAFQSGLTEISNAVGLLYDYSQRVFGPQ